MRGIYSTQFNSRLKYGSKKTVTGGVKYDSKMEAKYSQILEIRKKAGEIQDYEPQFTVAIYIGGSLWRKWRIDFKVTMKDGEVQLHEVKGFETMDYQQKRDAFLKVQGSECDCNYVTEYRTGAKIEKHVGLIIVKK